MRRGVVVAGLLVVVALAGTAVVLLVKVARPVPPAHGKRGDACRASGPSGVVGLDVATGTVRWTNVVGSEATGMWTPKSQPSGRGAHFLEADGRGRARTISVDTGAVTACRKAGTVPIADLPKTTVVDRSGATALDRAAPATEVLEPGGRVRWRAEGRHLVGSSPGGVVVRTDQPDECCTSTPALSIEVLEPASGHVRWAREIHGLEADVTARHLVVLDQFPDQVQPPGPGAGAGGSRITAYDLATGREAWRVDLREVSAAVYVADDLVVTEDGAKSLLAIDEAGGKVAWRVDLPNPGRGERATEAPYLQGAARSGDTLGVVLVATVPESD